MMHPFACMRAFAGFWSAQGLFAPGVAGVLARHDAASGAAAA